MGPLRDRQERPPLGTPPGPEGVRTYDDLSLRLQKLRAWAGVSYRQAHRLVVNARRARGLADLPAYDTVYRCFQPGRSRMETDLVIDIVGVLTDDPAQTALWQHACQVVAGWTTAAAIVSVSADLPADLDSFTGRREVVERVLGLAGGPARVIVIEGMAGIGKTTLAVRAARLLADRVAFGTNLHVDLRGYDAELPPAAPSAVLDGFLRALGVPGARISGLDLAGRERRYQELTVEKPVLVLLDNAASAEQIAPLLPAGTGSLTLVTSRRRLKWPDGFVLASSASVRLDVLTAPESLAMLRHAVGGDRAAEDPAAARAIVDLAGHLPLAIAVIAAQIREKADWTLSDHAERLADLRAGQHVEDAVGVALSTSYERLPGEHRRMLRLLAAHPGRSLDRFAAAALADAGLPAAETLLRDLETASLLRRDNAGRYGLHDLVRTFVMARARDEEAPSARRAALGRLLDGYCWTAAAAVRLYHPQTRLWFGALPCPGVPVPDLRDWADADAWFAAERGELISAALAAIDLGRADDAGRISGALARFLLVRGHLDDAALLHGTVAGATEGPARAGALTDLASARFPAGQFGQAEPPLLAALETYRKLGDRLGQSTALNMLGLVDQNSGRTEQACERFEAALALAEEADSVQRLAYPLGNLGHAYNRLGRHADALACYQRAHQVADLSDKLLLAQTSWGVGQQLVLLRRFAEAHDRLRQSLAIAEEAGYAFVQAYACNDLGSACSGTGEHDAALRWHRRALSIAADNGFSDLEFRNDHAYSLAAAGRCDEALAQYRAARTLAVETGDKFQEARACQGIARTLASRGGSEPGDTYRDRAAALYAELGLPTPDGDPMRR